jgi:hypothetical protein
MKFFCRNQSKFFDNFPIDDDGKVVRLVEFEAMQDDHLTLWRDHLVSSFSRNPVENPFRFRTRTGGLPQLTMLTMGKDVKKASAKSTAASKRSVKGKSKNSKKDSVTKKGRARHVKESKETELSEASMTDGSDTYSDDEEGKDDPLPPRSKVPRKSAENAVLSIGRQARREAKFNEERNKKHPRTISPAKSGKPSPGESKSKTFPGSKEQLMKKRANTDASYPNAYYSEDEILLTDSASLYLQTKGMRDSTLLESWKKPHFRPGLVSARYCLLFRF